MVKKLGVPVSVALLLLTSACGGRPSESDVSKGLQGGFSSGGQNVKLTSQQADCAAKIFVKSKISDATLKAIADEKKDYKPSKKDAAIATKLSKRLAGCIG
jgi:hypothetical protein